MMAPKINIVFDNNGVFLAGQVLTGKVSLNLSEETKYRGLNVTLSGDAQVSWSESHTEGSGEDERTVTTSYTNSENYFHTVITLTVPSESGGTQRHPAGYKEYPFWVQLPVNLPSSFEGPCGFVRYTVKAIFDRPWKFDYKAKSAFSVQSILDLNTHPTSKSPKQSFGEKTICCLCCASGPIQANLQLPKFGYVPGEHVPLQGEIRNASATALQLKVQLIQTTKWIARNGTKETVKKVFSVGLPTVGSHSTHILNEYMQIPALPPSGLVGCKIIDIDYTIKLFLSPVGYGSKLVLNMPLLIGTVPLRGNFITYPTTQQFSNTESQALQPTAPSAPVFTQPTPASVAPTQFSSPIGPADAEPPPPSYAECVFGRSSIREKADGDNMEGNLDFAPVYQFYGSSTVQPSAPPPPLAKGSIDQ